ncbi:MAG: transcription/translation regulatory transformer protein RfaH [Proteobacteria bacterium]|nr:MAG: transcription/translation regulatory transformer protein RfaH [Pseudomonadota bacterium]
MGQSHARSASVEGKSWYLVYSKPRGEKLAVDNLERQGYHIYLPMLQTTRRQRGRLVDLVEPMFPRYLFISLDTSTDNWAPIRSTVGVTQMVRFGNQPALVPDQLVQLLMDRENELGLQTPPSREFEKGERVRIYDGPFKDYEAIFIARNSNERVVVLLEILGKESRVAIKPGHLAGAR